MSTLVSLQLSDSFRPIVDGVAVCAENYARGLHVHGIPTAAAAPWTPEGDIQTEFPLFRYASLPVPGWAQYRAGLPDLDLRFRYFLWNWISQYTGKEVLRLIPSLPKSDGNGIFSALRFTRTSETGGPVFIIHSHSPFASSVLAQRIRSRLLKAGIPAYIVATLHTKYHMDLQRSLPEPVVEQVLRLIRRHFEAADQVWTLNPGTRETLEGYGYTGSTEIVPNGCDYEPPDDRALVEIRRRGRRVLAFSSGIGEDDPVFLFVGRLSLQKNISLVLQALARVDHAGARGEPGSNTNPEATADASAARWRMVFAGDGPDRAAVERQVADLGLGKRVTFLGAVKDRERLAEVYAAADLLVFPSVFDNDPLVVREAAAFRVPAVLARGSNSATSAVDGQNAFLVEPEVEPLAGFLQRLLNTGPAFSVLREVGIGASRELYRSWGSVVADVAERYRELAD